MARPNRGYSAGKCAQTFVPRPDGLFEERAIAAADGPTTLHQPTRSKYRAS